MVTVRLATPSDAAGILQIYAPIIQHTAISFETVAPSVTEMESRIRACLQKFPWIVCKIDNETAGYVYASKHREREAYQWTCECTVYINEKYRGKKIGAELYTGLFAILQKQKLVNVYAGITLPNEASVRLHENCGFTFFAEYENIGYKMGTWHKVGWWKLRLNDYEPKPSPPLSFPELNHSGLSQLFSDAANAITKRLSP